MKKIRLIARSTLMPSSARGARAFRHRAHQDAEPGAVTNAASSSISTTASTTIAKLRRGDHGAGDDDPVCRERCWESGSAAARQAPARRDWQNSDRPSALSIGASRVALAQRLVGDALDRDAEEADRGEHREERHRDRQRADRADRRQSQTPAAP